MSPEGLIYPGLAYVVVLLGTGVGFICGMMIGSERAYNSMRKDAESEQDDGKSS
jgi:uncharacterized membrane protein